jgi:hypothetical protein
VIILPVSILRKHTTAYFIQNPQIIQQLIVNFLSTTDNKLIFYDNFTRIVRVEYYFYHNFGNWAIITAIVPGEPAGSVCAADCLQGPRQPELPPPLPGSVIVLLIPNVYAHISGSLFKAPGFPPGPHSPSPPGGVIMFVFDHRLTSKGKMDENPDHCRLASGQSAGAPRAKA